jgi:hypothetical protein
LTANTLDDDDEFLSAVKDIVMFGLFVYSQNIQIRIADTFYYPYRIAADLDMGIWIYRGCCRSLLMKSRGQRLVG